jgi:circadian clock protein KaiC
MDRDLQVQSIAHAAISLEQLNPEYGTERRRLRVVKYRGVAFRGGFHDYSIRHGGLEVYPRLVAAEHRQHTVDERFSSGIRELDQLLGGGIERGTSTLIAGAAGCGKSSMTAQFVASAVARGQHAAMFTFDESLHTLVSRSASLGADLQKALDTGRLILKQVDPAELSPGEFAWEIRRAVEKKQASVVVIDSLNGYLNAMPDEHFLINQLHELLAYLAEMGVATLIVAAHSGIIGGEMHSPVDATYLADSVILLRYFEAFGEIKQAISVIKKRGGRHERTIREFSLDAGGIRVGEPLRAFRGVLTGVPAFEGRADTLMEKR